MQQPNPRVIAGAVDLSALRAKPQPAAATPAGSPDTDGAPSSSPYVIDVDEASFQADILERSMQTPVVIDFWAEWCGPCKQLSPVLEKLAAEGNGAWVLAKVDVDANQRLAAAFRVQSIPMVVAIVDGQPVDAFAGVQPEAQLRQWLAAVVNAGGGAQASDAEPALDPRLVEADDKLQAGDFDGAEAAYKAVLAEAPGDPYAASGLAQLELFRRLESVDPAAALAAAEANPEDVAAQTVAADVEFASGEAARAFDRLIATVRRTTGDDRDAARVHLLGLFAIAAPDDPVVVSARRALTNALF